MAEITVKAVYESKLRSLILGTLRMTFPVWGIASPLAFVGVLVAAVCAVYYQHAPLTLNAELYNGIGFALSLLIIPLGGLMLVRALSKNSLLIDKTGVMLPFDFADCFRLRRFYPWSSIKKVAVGPSDAKGWKDKHLVFYTDQSKAVKIQLRNYKPHDFEQVLVSFEMWGSQSELDHTVLALQESIRNEMPALAGHSYTDMWEDELRHRFTPTAFMPLEPGRMLRNGSLKVVRQLAIGGLSALYVCQLNDKQLVVLKEAVTPEDSAESVREKARELFEREAQLLSRLNHPAIVRVLDFFVDGGRNYIMLEFVSGQDLRQFVKQNGPQRETTVADWAIQVANIMKHLHEQDPPIIHRDLTPDNLVLREDGSVILIDFGAANEFISKATGTFVGKQSFIAPEQFRGKAVVQSDIYAFGCTLFFLLTGQEPEALSTSSPRSMNPAVSVDLDEVVQSCTQLDARDRFQSAAQLIPVLRKIAASALGVV